MLTILRKLLNKNPLRNMSDTDRKVLAICMGAALFFWLLLNLSRDYSIRKTVSINYLLDPERMQAKDSPVLDEQTVEVYGPGWDLLWESLWFQKISVNIDLRGKKSLELSQSDFQQMIQRRLSSGDLRVNNLDFTRRTFITSDKKGKTVPVVSRVDFNFSDGFIATSAPVFTPDSILVEGAEDLLAELTEWPTEAIVLNDVQDDIRRSVLLATSENSLEPSRTYVTMELPVEAFIQRSVEIPVTVINAPPVDSFEVIPAAVRLLVTLPQSAYYAIRPDDFSVVADLGDIRNLNGKNSVPLSLRRQPQATISATMATKSVEYYLIK